MLGYMVPDKPELKIKEYELYSAYYCGICKSIKKRYGQIPRLALNYDSVFLAVTLGSLFPSVEDIKLERCPVHPLKKRTVVYKEIVVDYAGDMMLLLAYYKLRDDRQDEKSLKALIGLAALKGTYEKIMKIHREKCIMVEDRLDELSKLERQKCPSLDRAAEPFASLMGEIFAADSIFEDENTLKLLRKIGYHVGKWLYLIDAYDDLTEDAEKGNYNPLLIQWNYQPSQEKMEDFQSRIRQRTEFNLMFYLTELSKAFEGLVIQRNQGLVENMLYSGLLKKTEEILTKGNTEDAESL